MIEEVPDFKAFIKPYIRSGTNRLIGYTKAQQFRFYKRDDGTPAMQYKLLCTSQDWSPPEGLLVWCVDADGKAMLPDGEPKPCKPIAMKNLEDILKGISGFIQYWESLKDADVGGSCWYRYGSWIHYWIRVRDALADLHQDSPDTLRQGFWPKTRIDVQASDAHLLANGEVSIRCLMWTTITLGLPVNVHHLLFALLWIVMKVTCSFCVLEMRHIRNQCGWPKLCPNQTLQFPVRVFDK